MKRMISLVLAVLFVAAMMVACGDSGPDVSSNPAGKYFVKTINGKSLEDSLNEELKDTGMTIDDALKMAKVESINDLMFLELNEDGSAKMVAMGIEMTGTWKQDGSKLNITIDGDTQVFTIDGSTIKGTTDDQEYVFEKQ